MNDYTPNSHRFKEEKEKAKALPPAERKKLDKVATGTRVKKKGANKFAEVFLSEDVSSVKSYILMDVLVPAIKQALHDVVTNGIDMILFGETGRSKRSSNADRVSYSRFYDRRDDRRRDEPISRVRAYSHDEVRIPTRGEAEEILARMDEIVATYGMVSVADYYELAGVSCDYTDNNYGWTSIRSASVVRVRDGYIIKMPKALPID